MDIYLTQLWDVITKHFEKKIVCMYVCVCLWTNAWKRMLTIYNQIYGRKWEKVYHRLFRNMNVSKNREKTLVVINMSRVKQAEIKTRENVLICLIQWTDYLFIIKQYIILISILFYLTQLLYRGHCINSLKLKHKIIVIIISKYIILLVCNIVADKSSIIICIHLYTVLTENAPYCLNNISAKKQ